MLSEIFIVFYNLAYEVFSISCFFSCKQVRKCKILRGLTLTLASIMLVLSCSIQRDKEAGVLLARIKFDIILMFGVERPPDSGIITVHPLTYLTVEVEEQS